MISFTLNSLACFSCPAPAQGGGVGPLLPMSLLRPGHDPTPSASYPLPGLGWTPALERPCLRKAIASISI